MGAGELTVYNAVVERGASIKYLARGVAAIGWHGTGFQPIAATLRARWCNAIVRCTTLNVAPGLWGSSRLRVPWNPWNRGIVLRGKYFPKERGRARCPRNQNKANDDGCQLRSSCSGRERHSGPLSSEVPSTPNSLRIFGIDLESNSESIHIRLGIDYYGTLIFLRSI